VEIQATDPQAANPKAADPQAADPKAAATQESVTPDPVDPATDSPASGQAGIAAKASPPKSPRPRTAARPSGPRPADPKVMPATAEQTRAGAEIIPFPVKPAAPAPANDAQDRLARALASLDAALAEQRQAMSGWRESLDHLRKATTGLGLSMQRYDRTLGKLGLDVSALHTQSVRLERWADDALKQRD
jgi:hypothetical protein